MTVKNCILLSVMFCSVAALAQAEAGKAAYQACISCHGDNAQGNAVMKGPALAGQNADYIGRQLRHFKQGVRGSNPKDVEGQQMRAMVNTLADDAAIDAVAEYLAQMTPVVPDLANQAAADLDLRNGANQYNGYCGACHGAKAEGNPILNAPRLAGLDVDYMKRQMQHFQNGVRGAAKGDRYGMQMAMMAGTLPAKDLDDVLGFILSAAVVD